MTYQHHSYRERLLDVAPLPSRSPNNHHTRRGWGTVIGFAVTLALILGMILSGLGLPSPISPPPIHTSG